MKNLLLLLTVFTLISCGKNTGNGSDNDKNQPEVTCGGMTKSSRSATACMPRFDITIFSNSLPAKILVGIKKGDYIMEILNECREHVSGEVARSADVDVIRTKFYGTGVKTENHIVIMDLGENCDNDAIFFDAVVTPTIIGNKVSYSLNN